MGAGYSLKNLAVGKGAAGEASTAMKTRRKTVTLVVSAAIVCAVVVAFLVYRSRAAAQKVFVTKVVRENLSSIVSGTGEIKPKNYVNIGATAFGPIAHLYVREGDRVKKGEVLAVVENVPQKSAVGAQKATIASIEKDIAANLAAEKAAEATIQNAEADLEQKTLDYKRAQELYKSALISRQDFDARRAAYNVAVAVLAQDKATLAQTNAQTASSRAKLASARQTLVGNRDAYSKSISVAPFDGIVTNLPVRQGETVVEGIQNAQGSTIMTLANMAVVTAEVKVDETDIIGVKIGQVANVTVDALPGEVFKGHVTEVGDQALLRSTGLSTSQSTTGSEEAKDFKVVVTLDHPLPELRPGMSATANIITAHKNGVIAVPLQALAMGNPKNDTEQRAHKLNASLETGPTTQKPKLVQGVFVLHKDGRRLRAVFVPVETGITGTSDIEVTKGVKPGDEIVTGPYRVLRNLKSDAVVQRDTSLPETETAG